jgi:OmpA-OmpF porin, OOP family
VNKTLIAGAVALFSLASGSAFAQTYVGGNIGASHANRGCEAAIASGAIDACDKNDFAWKLYGGYQMPGTPFAGELTYFDLGKFQATGAGTSAEAKASYWGLGGAYRPSFGSGWGGVARVGAAYGTSKVDYNLGDTLLGEHSKNGWHPYYGLGVNYEIAKNIKLEADWDNTRITSQVPSFGSTTNVVNSYTLGASIGF